MCQTKPRNLGGNTLAHDFDKSITLGVEWACQRIGARDSRKTIYTERGNDQRDNDEQRTLSSYFTLVIGLGLGFKAQDSLSILTRDPKFDTIKDEEYDREKDFEY